MDFLIIQGENLPLLPTRLALRWLALRTDARSIHLLRCTFIHLSLCLDIECGVQIPRLSYPLANLAQGDISASQQYPHYLPSISRYRPSPRSAVPISPHVRHDDPALLALEPRDLGSSLLKL